ncbi:TauD/TfdA dioxygenase family protein [Rhodopirellula sp. MGV]|uniref:TauD/TfdA dioxygenase family protein n=1 Tax=Rhodopirellula sp. MGV TaxID=2023130 RepID=UPI000B95D9B2|nr:TauD/TfdA family dioxygenase [Rhodopirellula sp. MGV]OYP33881.1 taurine dioxygenase [Rhodopirellula sp. MGV]PNY37302.1 taurine dioxygenase [Rhodopirellula baltica]
MSNYQHFQLQQIAGTLGAEVSGVDLSTQLSDDVIAEIRKALLDHLVLFFRDQNLTPDSQIAFARRFGDLDQHDFVKGLPDHPKVIRVLREADETTMNFGGTWHCDVTHQECPAMGSVLYGVDVPPYGGDTLFANQYIAYETLSAGMQQLLDGLTAVHSARGPFSPTGRAASYWKNMQVTPSEKAYEEVEHPAVRTHPETGRKLLFVNRTFTVRFKDMTERESAPLLQYLFEHASQEQFTCRFRWTKGAVAFWDNRAVLHHALGDYSGHRREMLRVAISGDRPY